MTTINTTSNYSTTTTTFTPSPPPAAIVPLNSFPSNLPLELVLKIFEHLNLRDLVGACQLVCKQWCHIVLQDSVWQNLCERRFQLLAVPKGIKNFQEAYKKRDLLYSNLKNGVFASISINQISQVSTPLISADGKIFSGHYDHSIRIWDSNTGKLISALEGGDAIYALAYAKGQLFSGDLNGVIKVWDSNTYKCTATFEADQGQSVHALAYADDNKLVVASGDLSLKVLDLTTGEYTFLGKLYDRIIFLKYADGRLFSGDRSEFNVWNLNVWDPKEGEYTPDTIDMNSAVSFVYADGMLISGDIYQNIKFWDLATGDCTTIISTESDQTKDSGGCFLAYADGILFAYVANKIMVWNPKTQEYIAIFEQEPGKEQMRYVDMIYVDGKLSCYEECKPEQDYKLITMDFTASHTVILEEIACLFERRQPITDLKAWNRLTKMPTSTIRKITGNAQGDPYINDEQWAHSTSEHWIQLIRNYVKKQREEERHPLLTHLGIIIRQHYSEKLGCTPEHLHQIGIVSAEDLKLICSPFLDIQRLLIEEDSAMGENFRNNAVKAKADRRKSSLFTLSAQLSQIVAGKIKETNTCGVLLYAGESPWINFQNKMLNPFQAKLEAIVQGCSDLPKLTIEAFETAKFNCLAAELNSLVKDVQTLDRQHQVAKLHSYVNQFGIVCAWINLHGQGIQSLENLSPDQQTLPLLLQMGK